MSTQALYYPHAVITPTATIAQLRNPRSSNNYQDIAEFAAGTVGPYFTGAHQAAPDLLFETTDLKTILDDCNTAADFRVLKDYSAGNVDVEYRKSEDKGVRIAAASLDHLRARMTSNAFLTWQTISAQQGQLAEITCRLLPVYDGANNPVIFTSGLALGATSSITGLYTLGPINLNGGAVGGIKTVRVENQIEYEEEAADGNAFVDFAAVKTITPRVTFTARNSALAATYGLPGTALTAIDVYFRKKTASGINSAVANTDHIKLSGAAGTIRARGIDGDEANVEVTVDLAESSGQWWTALDTASAIT